MRLLLPFILIFPFAGFGQTMQGTIKPGSQPRTIDVYLKPSASFSQKDEAMTLVLAIPATVGPAPTMGTTGVQQNGIGAVAGVSGLQPDFLVNNLGSTQRELVVSTQSISGASYYIYTFIFAGTAPANHEWVANTEQHIFSIQFNGCVSNCNPSNELLVNLPNGGVAGNAYWYFQPNTLGDITNYSASFYANSQSTTPVNGGDPAGLSTVGLAALVSLPIKLSSFTVNASGCSSRLSWQVAYDVEGAFFSVERSRDGGSFSEISRIMVAPNLKSYSFIDNSSQQGRSYYRLRLVDKDGQFSYSVLNKVDLNCLTKDNTLIYPTFTTGMVNIKLSTNFTNATIRVLNASGQELAREQSNNNNRSVNLTGKPNGLYILQVISKGSNPENFKVTLHQ